MKTTSEKKHKLNEDRGYIGRRKVLLHSNLKALKNQNNHELHAKEFCTEKKNQTVQKKQKVEFTKCFQHMDDERLLCAMRQMELSAEKLPTMWFVVFVHLFRFYFAIYERNTHLSVCYGA